jgi:predicted Rossmann fold nucleotide-binding protein DprA/Smf involved in DNA uptake
LREQSPPLVYVAGPVSLLERGGIAAVGSREVDEDGAAFARAAGRAAARAGTPMISGGARGVDREAMFSAIDADGEAVGIMPNGLARALRTTEVRRRVGAGQLTLASPHRPNSGFEVWKAMGRNKLIYALADVSLVISSEAERGGTWAGAIENMRHDWSPLFVRAGPTVPAGNRRLLELGALPIDESDFESVPRPRVVEWLLDRAKRESVDTAAEQSLLDDEDNLPAPSRDSPGRDESAGASDSPPADPDPSQLRLLERF